MIARLNSPLSPLNVDEEYNNAFRTKSFIDIYTKLHHRQRQEDDQDQKQQQQQQQQQQPSPQSSQIDVNQHFTGNSSSSFGSKSEDDFHDLLLDFFNTTKESSAALSSLLSSLALARSHHRSIHRLLVSLSKCTTCPQPYCAQLSSYLKDDNPLSAGNLTTFHAVHSRYPDLIQRLNAANKKVERRLRIRKLIVLVFGSCGGKKRWERVKKRVDGAAKGAYIVGRDMDTVSRMVRRVEDEVEHGREVGRMVVRNIKEEEEEEEWGIVKQVVREIEGGEREMGLEEQVEELEEHVYLCLITINKSRRMVAQDMEHS